MQIQAQIVEIHIQQKYNSSSHAKETTEFYKNSYKQSINARNITWIHIPRFTLIPQPSLWKYNVLKNISKCQGVSNQVKVIKDTCEGGKAPKRRYIVNRIQCMKIQYRKPNCKSVLPTNINLQNPDYRVIDNFLSSQVLLF